MGAAEGFHGGDLPAWEPFFALGALEAEEIIEQAKGIGQQRQGKKQAIARPVLEPKEQIAQHHHRHIRHQLVFQPDHEFGQLPRGKIHGKSPPDRLHQQLTN